MTTKLSSSFVHLFITPQVPIDVLKHVLCLTDGKEDKEMSSMCSKKIFNNKRKNTLLGRRVCVRLEGGHGSNTHIHINTSKSSGHSCLAL